MTRRITAAVLAVALALSSPARAANPPAPNLPSQAQSVTDTLLAAGTARTQGAIWYSVLQNASVAANTNSASPTRTLSASGAGQVYGYYQCSVGSSVAGTMYIANGQTNGISTTTVPAGTLTTTKILAFGPNFACSFTTGSSGGNVSLYDGFTVD